MDLLTKKQQKSLLDEAINRLRKYSSFSSGGMTESLSGVYWRLAKVAECLEAEMDSDRKIYNYDPEKYKNDDEIAQGFDRAFNLLVEAKIGFLDGSSAAHGYWRVKAAFLFVESKVAEIDGDDDARRIIEIHGNRVARKSGKPCADNPKKFEDDLNYYAVIGAMATTGGDAEEAARLLGVTVDFINERF
jgi:hypothetical protein